MPYSNIHSRFYPEQNTLVAKILGSPASRTKTISLYTSREPSIFYKQEFRNIARVNSVMSILLTDIKIRTTLVEIFPKMEL